MTQYTTTDVEPDNLYLKIICRNCNKAIYYDKVSRNYNVSIKHTCVCEGSIINEVKK